MTTTTNQTVSSVSFKQSLRQIISNTVNTYFSATLGREQDIVNICMSLIYLESSFNPNAVGKPIPIGTSSSARDYYNSPVIQNVLRSGSSFQKLNINEGLVAQGLMQCMGWNTVRGASIVGGGKQVIETARPDLAGMLCVNPGDSISAKYAGQANIQNQVLAGLVILESKYKAVKQSGATFTIGKLPFSAKIPAAVAGYLGLGARDVVTGITPVQYSNSICYGSAYKTANNNASPTGYLATSNPSVQQTASGPVQTDASGNNQVPVGC